MIEIGVTPKDKPYRRIHGIPGSESNGILYHGEYGRIYYNNEAVDQTDTYTTGDTVGCYLYRASIGKMMQTLVQFTKNGVVLDPIRYIQGDEYYPTVGSGSAGSIVETNFGQNPFKCDIEGK